MSDAAAKRKPFFTAGRLATTGAIAARVLGLVRDVVFAAIFRRDETDAFFVAFTLPNVLRQILGDGAASNAVAPVLSTRLAREGEASARALFQRIRGAAIVVLALVAGAGMLLARPLTELLAGGYHDRPGMFERTVALSRSMFPYVLLSGLAALGTAALHVKRRHTIGAFAPVLLNVAFIVAAVALPSLLDARGFERGHAIVAGALLGTFAQIAVQFSALRRAGWTGQALVDFRDPALRDIARRLAPIALSVLLFAVDLIVARRLLSDFGAGPQSWFTWAMRLCDFPQQVLAILVAAVAATSLARVAAKSGADEVGKAASAEVRLALFVVLPASAALVVLAHPIVVLVFQHGELDELSAWETSRALVWQAAALSAAAASRQLVALLYVVRDSRGPLVASALGFAAFLATALALRARMGHVAVSVAVAASTFTQLAALVVLARRRVPSFSLGPLARSAARTVAAVLAASVAAWSTSLLVPALTAIGHALSTLAALAAFAVMYAAAAWSLRSPELAAIVDAARGRGRARR